MINVVNDNATIPVTPVTLCKLFPDAAEQCDIVDIVRRLVASVSLLGSIFMIAVIWLFRKYTILSHRLILYLSCGALLECISYLVGGPYLTGPACTFQAFMSNFATWANLIWVCVITFNLYINAVRMIRLVKYEWLYHLLAWGFSFVISCLPLSNNKYGPSGGWCWIEDDWKWRFGIWYGPLYIILGILIAVYSFIVIAVKRKIKTWEGLYDPDMERKKQLLNDEVKPLVWYPFVYLGLSLFPLINRVHNAIHPGTPAFPLVLLMVIFAPMLGAVNALIFGLDRETRSRLTLAQIRVAWESRRETNIIREYPVGLITDVPTEELQSPKFNNVSYSRLH